MENESFKFKQITYEQAANQLAKFPSRVPIFYIDGDELNQIKTPEEFIHVVSSGMRVYRQV